MLLFPPISGQNQKIFIFPKTNSFGWNGDYTGGGGGVTNWILKHVPPFGAGFVLPNAPCQMVRLESTVRATVPGGVRRS